MNDLATRLMQRDITLWPAGNVASNRLGWVGIADIMRQHADDINAWAKTISARTIVLIGMGGSSLGPEVLRAAMKSDRLIVVDTTDPATVRDVPTDDAVFIVSSKSGGTLEVQALLAHFWTCAPDGNRWIAITDPGTELESIARDRAFSRVFLNPPDIGGRFSVLSYFGLVPAALVGYDVAALCDMANQVDVDEAVALGQRMATATKAGQDKLTLVLDDGPFAALGLWLEQLIAESTGKRGIGCVPVPTTEKEGGEDRLIEFVSLTSPVELGREFYRWEIATAIAGHVLEIDPFDEPNVTESKQNTMRVLSALPLNPPASHGPADTIAWLQSQVKPGDYVSIQAYLPYRYADELEALRATVRDALGGIAVTAGFGPRFLHSTGQLHKGGANNIVALQLVPKNATAELDVPGKGYDFATLIGAQAIGDVESLEAHDRRVRRVECTSPSDIS